MKRLSVLAAVVLVVLMVHAWGGFAVSVSPLVSCNPDCTGMATGDKVVDPKNCTQFYRCNQGVAYGPEPCDPGTVFDETTGDCMPGTECTSICGPGSGCPLTCNDTLTPVGDAFNCSAYYICSPGEARPQGCPSNRPYYDGNTKECVTDESVCCTGYCQPYCDGTQPVVPDPTDCTKFYFCDGEGIPESDQNFPCNGGYFNVQLGNCETGTPPNPCPTLCDAAGGTDGTSTSTTTSTTTTSGGGGGGSTDINGCVSSLVCTAAGNFPACSTCQPDYFVCSGPGATGEQATCTDGYVFDTNPENANCVLASHCPTT